MHFVFPPASPGIGRRDMVCGATALIAAGLLGPVPGLTQLNRPPIGPAIGAFESFPNPAPMPNLAFEYADGTLGALVDFHGRFVLLNLWATWCAPCVREMPALNRLQAAFDPAQLLVLPLSLDRGGARAVAPFYAKVALDRLGIYLDKKNTAMRELGPPGLPTTYLITPEGDIAGWLVGPAHWDADDAVALMRWYLDQHTRARQSAWPDSSES